MINNSLQLLQGFSTSISYRLAVYRVRNPAKPAELRNPSIFYVKDVRNKIFYYDKLLKGGKNK